MAGSVAPAGEDRGNGKPMVAELRPHEAKTAGEDEHIARVLCNVRLSSKDLRGSFLLIILSES